MNRGIYIENQTVTKNRVGDSDGGVIEYDKDGSLDGSISMRDNVSSLLVYPIE
jgi:hypothetical protein